MSNEKKEATKAELSAWRDKREKRKRERSQQQQKDETSDDFDELARFFEKNDGYVDNADVLSGKTTEDNGLFVPLTKRKRIEKEALIGRMAHRRSLIGNNVTEAFHEGENDIENNVDTVGMEKHDNEKSNGGHSDDNSEDPKNVESLLDSAAALGEALTEEERAEKSRKAEESRIMKEASKVQTNALQAASELAKGIEYTDPMPSTWTCPRYILDQGASAWEKIRKEWHMEVEGVDVPPPCKRFVDMKFAPPILEVLHRKGIKKPTPIQMQGLTVVR